MQYTVHQAKTQLSRLLKEIEAGKEVVIARGSKPVARLLPIERKERPERILGIFKGQGWAAPDAFDPVTDEELNEWGLL